MQSVALIFILFTGGALLCTAQPEVDLCRTPIKEVLTGRPLVAHVRVGFTMHGVFLLSDQCALRIPAALVVNPGDPGVPVVPFQLDGDARERLSPFLRPAGGSAVACGTMEGQFVRKKGFHLRRGEPPSGNGFGARGTFELMFVLKAVEELHGCD